MVTVRCNLPYTLGAKILRTFFLTFFWFVLCYFEKWTGKLSTWRNITFPYAIFDTITSDYRRAGSEHLPHTQPSRIDTLAPNTNNAASIVASVINYAQTHTLSTTAQHICMHTRHKSVCFCKCFNTYLWPASKKHKTASSRKL